MPSTITHREGIWCQGASRFDAAVTFGAANVFSTVTAFTQTYSTALATNPAALTDNSTGTADATIEVVGATNSGDVSGAINNNFAECAAHITSLQKLCNSIIDTLQANGMAS